MLNLCIRNLPRLTRSHPGLRLEISETTLRGVLHGLPFTERVPVC